MKRLIVSLILLSTVIQCQEEKPLIDQAIEARCSCLDMYEKEKNNILEVLQCSDEVTSNEKFAELDQLKIIEGVQEFCPNSSLPLDEMVQ